MCREKILSNLKHNRVIVSSIIDFFRKKEFFSKSSTDAALHCDNKKKPTAAAPHRDNKKKNLPLPRRTATTKTKTYHHRTAPLTAVAVAVRQRCGGCGAAMDISVFCNKTCI
jgi:hypothetical protein